MSEQLVVAADGGNSKTQVVLADRSGRVHAVVRTAGIKNSDGIRRTAQILTDAVRAALRQADRDPATALAAGAFFLANVDVPEEEVAVRDALAAHALADTVLVRNDVFAILHAGTSRDWGVAVTVGAGINAVGRHPDGREARFLALGDISGDWGGGLTIGVAALGAAVRAGDGRGPDTILRDAVTTAFGADPEEVAVRVSRGGLARRELHRLARAALTAASSGDTAATAIVTRLADEVVELAGTLLRRLALLDSDADVILGGAILQAGNDVLLDRIRARLLDLAPGIALRVLDAPPVSGALSAALDLADASPEAQRSARAALTKTVTLAELQAGGPPVR